MDATPSNAKISTSAYGGVLHRLVAYSVDCGLLFFGLLVLQSILFVVNPLAAIMRTGRQPSPNQFHLWVFATASVPFLFYFALMLRSSRQATLGMRLLKLKVVDAGGGRIGFWQSLLRSAVMLIPFELNHALIFHLGPRNAPPRPPFFIGLAVVWGLIAAYIVTILLTRRRQSVHDLLAGTVVQRLTG
jgi:uncharacterized RDD family membrane protein YckC